MADKTAQPVSECDLLLLANQRPADFLELLRSDRLQPSLLTFAGEIAGNTLPASMSVPALLDLLEHASSLVREGAVYGLAPHCNDPGVQSRLQYASEHDQSPGVRAAIRDGMDTFGEPKGE